MSNIVNMVLHFCRRISHSVTEGWVTFVDTSSPSLSSFLQGLDLDKFRISAYGLRVSVCARNFGAYNNIRDLLFKNLYGIGD
jgi:hypothetical protein